MAVAYFQVHNLFHQKDPVSLGSCLVFVCLFGWLVLVFLTTSGVYISMVGLVHHLILKGTVTL